MLRDNGRARRGFSLPEAAAAMAVLIVLSSIISLAVARSLTAQGQVKDQRAATSVLTAYLNEVAQYDFDLLLNDDFPRPDACTDDTRTTCTTLGEVPVEVTWGVELGEDLAGGTSATASSVTLRASLDLPGERGDVEVSKVVAAPIPGYAPGLGVLRVTLSGESYQGPLYLMGAGASPEVVASARARDSSALFRASPEKCAAAAPCTLALSPSGATRAGDLSLSPADVVGRGSGVVLVADALSDASATLRRDGALDLALVARSDAGGIDGTPALSSVCLWASFPDGQATRQVPLCNSTEADRIYASTYSAGGREFALPVNVPLTLSTDRPDGTCPQVPGMLGRVNVNGSWTWGPTSVCTSWTWGRPSLLETAASSQGFDGASVVLRADEPVSAVVVWSGDNARPAAGYGSEPRWSKPRDAQASPASTPAPESTTCPLAHCYSSAGGAGGTNRAPVVELPSRGGAAVRTFDVKRGASTPLVIGVRDHDSDAFQVRLASLPSAGTLRVNGTPVAAGANLGSFVAAGQLLVEYQAPADLGVTSMTLRLTDGVSSRDVEVGLVGQKSAWTVTGAKAQVRQGAGLSTSVKVVATDGEPLAGAEVVLDLPAGVTGTSKATTSPDGTARFDLDVDAAAPGRLVIPASAGGRTGAVVLNVLPAAGSVEVSVTGSSIRTVVKDRAGAPLAGASVGLVVLKDGNPANGVYPQQVGCSTGPDGSCSTGLVIDPNAAEGTYVIVASSGSSSDDVTLEVAR
jgi:type II secretory pathway pseudopilin PulG